MPADLSPESPADHYFGPYRFDGKLRRLYKDGEPVALTPKALETLAALLERAGRLVEKDELLRVVWGDVFVGDETLAQNISTLRRALSDDVNDPQFVATIPRRGYRFIADVRTVPAQVTPGIRVVPPMARVGSAKSLAVAAALVIATAAYALVGRWTPAEKPRAVVEFTIAAPESGRFSATGGMLAVSPDGAHLSYIVLDARGTPSLWIRPLSSSAARPLDGTEGAANPFWSPDSRTIAFFSERSLKAVDITSGAVRVLASLTSARLLGASWSRNGQILFSVPGDGMFLVPSTGGSPQRLAPALDARCEDCATWPHFLPDGRHFLYTVANSSTSQPGIYVGEVGKSGGRRLLDSTSSCTYVAPGFLSYSDAGTLYVQRFDPDSLQVRGTPSLLAHGVAHNARTGRVMAAISENGVLAFRQALTTQLVWVDRSGKELSVAAPPATYLDFAVSPDGQQVAVARVDTIGTSDIWVFAGGQGVRLSHDAAPDGSPVWSDDGDRVAYSSRREGRWRIYSRQASGQGREEVLLDAESPVAPLQILRSNDLVYSVQRASLPFDVWRLGQHGPSPLAQTGGFHPVDSRMSPDERWLAFGRPETLGSPWSQTIYLSGQPYGEARRAISDAASTPRWRADGRELFYLSQDSTIVSVPINPEAPGEAAPRAPLFRASGLAPTGVSGQVYDVTRDGLRFLLKREVGPSPIHVMLNWDARFGSP